MANDYDNTNVDRVDNTVVDENDTTVRHGIDNNPNNDAEKGAALGGLGGAAVGAIAGSMAGPVGGIIGGIIGAVVGGGASGAAVAAVDRVDNDNTVSGLGHSEVDRLDSQYDDTTARDATYDNTAGTGAYDNASGTGAYTTTQNNPSNLSAAYDNTASNAPAPGVHQVQRDTMDTTGSLNNQRVDGSYNSDALNQDTARERLGGNYDNTAGTAATGFDRTRDTLASDYDRTKGTLATDYERAKDARPEVHTGGQAYDGTPDTRGVMEKAADKLTGDHIDDKTGKVV